MFTRGIQATAEFICKTQLRAINTFVIAKTFGSMLFFVVIGIALWMHGTGPGQDKAVITGFVLVRQDYVDQAAIGPVRPQQEWAADQDPTFRRIFYTELLLDLKRIGKTLIVISHDDRYFDIADQCVRMETGRRQRLRNGLRQVRQGPDETRRSLDAQAALSALQQRICAPAIFFWRND